MISFTGNLEHLPIVDVMQLLHQTRKSGILRVKGRKGESQLVFKGGYMVSASHLNNSIRIGKILVDLNIITLEILDKALLLQSRAGSERKPLIITLINQGLVNENEAYKALEHLIEMAIVEILTWKKGSFTLEVLPTSVNDFRFYPGKLISEINVDTQSVLMDALRIYDEKRRDGELTDEEPPKDELSAEGSSPPTLAVCQQCGLVESECQAKLRKKQEMEREQQQEQHNQKMLFRSIRNPYLSRAPAAHEERNAAPLPVRYTGRGCFALGVALLCYGLYGLASYYGNDWQAILSEGLLEPISKSEAFFRFGFLPWLLILFSSVFLTVVGQFLLLRSRARKKMQMAAWAGVAVCAVYETAEFISWVRNSSSPTFFYCAIGLASSLLMTVLLSLPFLALLWCLQSEAIVREFPE